MGKEKNGFANWEKGTAKHATRASVIHTSPVQFFKNLNS
jgi:hypothetical protein